MSSSTKLSITGKALAKTELHIRDGDTSKFRPHSPLKRSILGDLENFLPSSPDLLLSVPETPKSQIRDPDQQLSREVVSPEKFGQLSPICRSPRSKGQSVRRVMTGDGRRTKREEGCSVSIKRLISPPQESHNVKRQKTVNPLVQRTVLIPTGGNLNVTKPVKIPDFSSDQSKDHSRGTGVVFNENKHKSETDFSGDQEKHQEEKDSAFTVITEQKAAEAKASGNSHTHLDEDTHTLTAHVHKPNAQNVTPAMQRSEKDGEIELNVKGEMRTTMTPPNGDRGSVTSSDQDRAGGTMLLLLHVLYLIVTTACSDFELFLINK